MNLFKRLFRGAKEKTKGFVEALTVEDNPTMKVTLDEGAYMPLRAHANDAGLDLFARETQVIPARERAFFDTGVHIELPPMTRGEIKSKSGLFRKHGITTDGTIDVGYNGSIGVTLLNNSGVDYEVKKGDKIAQLVISPIIIPELIVVDRLDETERGSGGFGSTGY